MLYDMVAYDMVVTQNFIAAQNFYLWPKLLFFTKIIIIDQNHYF